MISFGIFFFDVRTRSTFHELIVGKIREMKRVAVVVGGTRGIGKAIADRLVECGEFRVGVLGRSVEKSIVIESEDSIRARCDATSLDEVGRAMNAVEKHFGEVNGERGVHVLINAAGVNHDGVMASMNETQMDRIVRTNLLGPMYACKVFSRLALKHRIQSGSIVNIGSVIGSIGNVGQSVYSASKSGLQGLTKSLAKELGSRNIRVNLLEPGYIDIGMTSELDPNYVNDVKLKTCLQRLGTVEDVSNFAMFATF